MPAPLVLIGAGAIARAVAAAAAKQAAKQGVKKLTASQTKKIVRDEAAKRGIKKVSNIQARRIAEQSAGPKARRLGGEAGLRASAPKPGVRVTTRTSGGRGIASRAEGPVQRTVVKLTKRAEGPLRPGEKPTIGTKKVVAERMPPKSTNTEKVTVTRPVKRLTNKEGSAIAIRKTAPRKAADVRAEAQKVRRERLRESLTPRVNPARPKATPKRSMDSSPKSSAREQEIIDRYYRIRFGDKGGPTPRSAQGKQSSIESRLASGSERPTRGSVNTTGDKEATILAQRSMRALGSPKAAAKERVKPGQRTKVATAIKKNDPAKIKGSIRNMRKVLKEREIKETAERMRKAEEAAKKRGSK